MFAETTCSFVRVPYESDSTIMTPITSHEPRCSHLARHEPRSRAILHEKVGQVLPGIKASDAESQLAWVYQRAWVRGLALEPILRKRLPQAHTLGVMVLSGRCTSTPKAVLPFDNQSKITSLPRFSAPLRRLQYKRYFPPRPRDF